MNKFVLEKYRAFPYIAWALVISFALFVFALVQELQTVTTDLGLMTAQLETQVKTTPSEITGFDR
jgi:hypothetical protein